MTGHDGGTGTPPTQAPGDGGRAVPYSCPFCAEEDLRPVEDGRWHCRSCLRVFSVQFHGLAPASGGTPAPRPDHRPDHHPDPSPAPSTPAGRHA